MSSRSKEESASGLNDFVKKLFQMLLQHQYMDVVRWTALGNLFVVLDTNEFTKEILPRHFKHSNFASFVRQLNKYDFHKVKVANDEKQAYAYGDDAWEFQHPEFRKDDREALENIRRKAPLKKESALDQSSRYSSQLQALRHDLLQLQTDHKVLLDKYRAVLESMVAVRTYNERQYRSMGILVHTLEQAGIKVPPLDLPDPRLLGMVLPLQDVVKREDLGGVAPPSLIASIGLNVGLNMGLNVGPSSISLNVAPNMGLVGPVGLAISPTISLGLGLAPLRLDTGIQEGLDLAEGLRAGSEGQATFAVPNPKFHVLLVEDDNVCIKLCRKFLMKYGCLVTVVTDGIRAITTLERNKYDLVLMDIVMPNLDGATATSIIRLFDTKTPIIAMTGNIEDNDLVNYLQNGMSDILAKPFTKDDLYLILSKHLLEVKQEFADQPVEEYAALPLEGTHTPMEPMPMPAMPIAQSMTAPIMDPIEPIESLEPPPKKLRMH